MDIFLICLSSLLLLLVAGVFLTHCIVKKRFPRVSYPDHAIPEMLYGDFESPPSRIPVSFLSGKNRLHGYIYPSREPKGLLVFAHGIGTGHEHYLRDLLWMVDHGWSVLAYDATGSCESEGKGTVGLVQSAKDLDAALTFIESKKEFSSLPICLMGHSWGGYAVTAGLYFPHRVTASASICGYAHPLEMMIEFARAYIGKGLALLAPLVWIEQRITFGKYASLSAPDGINRADVPVLLIHAAEDEVVSLDKSSIVAHAKEIRSTRTTVFLSEREGQTGHGSVFHAEESLPYIAKVKRAWDALEAAHGKAVPKEEKDAFWRRVDKTLYNRPNEALLARIDAFFTEAIQHPK